MPKNIVSYDTKPTIAQMSDLQRAYDHFNAQLFAGVLPECLITIQRRKGTRGYFWGGIYKERQGQGQLDELALNPESFYRSDLEILSTLAHEMCHVWQHHHGKPSRNGYHNREWAAKMAEIGLIPSATGQPGGARTGQNMTHYIAENGAFQRVAAQLIGEGLRIRWTTTSDQGRKKSRKRNKTTYICPMCESKVWGKPELHVLCGDCMLPMTEETDDDQDNLDEHH